MNDRTPAIDAIVTGVQPPWKKWTLRDRIPEDTQATAVRHGDEVLVDALERLATSGLEGAVLASIWTLSCPGLPWKTKFATTLAKAHLRTNDEAFMITQAALRQIEKDNPDLGEEVLRQFFLSGSKRPEGLLFVFVRTGLARPELFLLCIKTACIKKSRNAKRPRSLSLDGLLFAMMLSETEAAPSDLQRLALEALKQFDEASWRGIAEVDQIITLSRDLLALLCLVAEEDRVQDGTKRIATWLSELPPGARVVLVFGLAIKLIEEGLGWWHPWLRPFLISFIRDIRELTWASAWANDFLARLESASKYEESGKPPMPSRAPIWRLWIESQGTARDAQL